MDLFKHFKVIPASDWKLNKKQGDVEEYFVSFIYIDFIKLLFRPKK